MQAKNFIDIAAAIAYKYKGLTFPNPSVGCVIVKSGQIIAKAATNILGSPHAEVQALKQAGKMAKGADLYVTLEPCSHFGKNPPCVMAIREAGIKRVFYANLDPNPLVNGKGIAMLKEYSIECKMVESEYARALHQEFVCAKQNHRPFVNLKLALSADNYSSYKNNQQQWITNTESRNNVHLLRLKSDAILTGIATVMADNPRLDVRLPGLELSKKIYLLDSRLQISEVTNLLRNHDKNNLTIFYHKASDNSKLSLLEKRGVKLIKVNQKNKKLDLDEVLQKIYQDNICNLLVESGLHLATSFIQANLLNLLTIYKSSQNLNLAGSNKFIFPHNVTLISEKKFSDNLRTIFRIEG